MQKQIVRVGKPVLAGVLAAAMLLLALLASSDRLHFRLHDNGGPNHGQCAVCAVATGQLEISSGVASVVMPVSAFVWTLPVWQAPLPVGMDFPVTGPRGPPASVASL